MTDQPTIIIRPGHPGDPEREQCFRGMQMACAGATIASALAAHLDSLATVIVAAATDRAHAEKILSTVECDLRKAIAVRWDAIKEEIGAAPRDLPTDALVSYDADYDREPNDGCRGKTRVSIHMPRRASRLTLTVTDVRVQRLQEISEVDAIAEGVIWSDRWKGFVVPGVEHPNKDFPVLSRPTAREMYGALWDAINGSGAWLGNPWIIGLTFTVEHRNIDALQVAA